MSFTAEYYGECDSCGENVKGHECKIIGPGKIIHVECPKSDLEVPARTSLCWRCFTYHNGECL